MNCYLSFSGCFQSTPIHVPMLMLFMDPLLLLDREFQGLSHFFTSPILLLNRCFKR